MKALLLIAHGSRRESSNQEVRDLAKCLAEDARPDFSTVVPAFLELAEPDIPAGVDLRPHNVGPSALSEGGEVR